MRFVYVCLVFVLFSGVTLAAEMVGEGRYVIDGDTFELALPTHTVKIRICGIDAPESGEPGSKEAWAKLSSLVHKKTVNCVQVNQGTVCDRLSKPTNRDRIVAQCFVEGRDVAVELVAAGVACDWQKFSGGHYQKLVGGKACSRN